MEIRLNDVFNNFVMSKPNLSSKSGGKDHHSKEILQLEKMDLGIHIHHPREKYDLFLPKKQSRGTIIFLHGGFWFRTGREHWSFTAQGMLSQNWSVIIPSYPQAPDVKITQITYSISELVYKILDDCNGSVRIIGQSEAGI